MIEKTIIQTAWSLIETIDGSKNKFEAWTRSVENAPQISGPDTLHIAFSKMTGSPLSSAHRSKAQSPNILNENCSISQESISNSTDEDDLMKLFDQFISFTSPMSG